MVVLCSFIVGQSGFSIVGGFNLSNFDGESSSSFESQEFVLNVDFKSVNGFKVGVQHTLQNGLIATYSFSQRGAQFSENSVDFEYYGYDFIVDYEAKTYFNYLSASFLNHFQWVDLIFLQGVILDIL